MILPDAFEFIENNDKNGAPTRTRTLDPLIKSQLLYQLSYRRITIEQAINLAMGA